MALLVLFPFSIWTKYSIKIVGQVFSQINLTQFFPANFFQLAHGKICKCHLIFWCRNFVGTYVFRRVSDDSFETLQTLCVSIKFPQQKNRWNYRILCIEYLYLFQYGLKKLRIRSFSLRRIEECIEINGRNGTTWIKERVQEPSVLYLYGKRSVLSILLGKLLQR